MTLQERGAEPARTPRLPPGTAKWLTPASPAAPGAALRRASRRAGREPRGAERSGAAAGPARRETRPGPAPVCSAAARGKVRGGEGRRRPGPGAGPLTGVLVPRPQVVGGGDDDEPHEAGEEVEERVAAVVVLELLPRHGRLSSAQRRPPACLPACLSVCLSPPLASPPGGPVSPSRLRAGPDQPLRDPARTGAPPRPFPGAAAEGDVSLCSHHRHCGVTGGARAPTYAPRPVADWLARIPAPRVPPRRETRVRSGGGGAVPSPRVAVTVPDPVAVPRGTVTPPSPAGRWPKAVACWERSAERRLAPGPPPVSREMAPLFRSSGAVARCCSAPTPRQTGVRENGWACKGALQCGEQLGGAALVLSDMGLKLGWPVGAAGVCGGTGTGKAAGTGLGKNHNIIVVQRDP